jgi:hypothetical protein
MTPILFFISENVKNDDETLCYSKCNGVLIDMLECSKESTTEYLDKSLTRSESKDLNVIANFSSRLSQVYYSLCRTVLLALMA